MLPTFGPPSRRLALALVLVFAMPAAAQDAELAAAPAEVHLLEIRDGGLHLDGRHLPDAVPSGLDLSGFSYAMEYAGPVKPVIEIDGQAYVLADERLQLFDPNLADGRLYIAGEARPNAPMPAERAARAGEQAYLQEVAARDTELYSRMRSEQQAEREGEQLAARIRAMPPGTERDGLRAQLRDHLADVFQLKLRVRRDEIAHARAELDELERLLEQREDNLDAIVDARVRALCDH